MSEREAVARAIDPLAWELADEETPNSGWAQRKEKSLEAADAAIAAMGEREMRVREAREEGYVEGWDAAERIAAISEREVTVSEARRQERERCARNIERARWLIPERQLIARWMREGHTVDDHGRVSRPNEKEPTR